MIYGAEVKGNRWRGKLKVTKEKVDLWSERLFE